MNGYSTLLGWICCYGIQKADVIAGLCSSVSSLQLAPAPAPLLTSLPMSTTRAYGDVLSHHRYVTLSTKRAIITTRATSYRASSSVTKATLERAAYWEDLVALRANSWERIICSVVEKMRLFPRKASTTEHLSRHTHVTLLLFVERESPFFLATVE